MRKEETASAVARLEGTLTAIATPFTEGGEVDYRSLERLVDFQIQSGVDGLVVCGSTGEAATLSDSEYRTVVARVKEQCPAGMPCIAGAITNSTQKAIEIAEFAGSISLDALLVVCPPYIKPTSEGIFQHFKAVKEACNIPLIAYNIPGRAAISMQPDLIARMFQAGLITAVKDSTGSLDHLLETFSLTGDKFAVLSGEDTLVYPIMACGGKGVISASANVFPKQFAAITGAALKHRWQEALSGQLEIHKSVKAMFLETNPIPVKAALRLLGIIESDFVRLPLTRATPQTVEKLKVLLS